MCGNDIQRAGSISTGRFGNGTLDGILVTGPGHGGPANVANAYLEGTYAELYPDIAEDEQGLRKTIPAVLVSGRHPEPRGPGETRLRRKRSLH